jgi:hypothetical protein
MSSAPAPQVEYSLPRMVENQITINERELALLASYMRRYRNYRNWFIALASAGLLAIGGLFYWFESPGHGSGLASGIPAVILILGFLICRLALESVRISGHLPELQVVADDQQSAILDARSALSEEKLRTFPRRR